MKAFIICDKASAGAELSTFANANGLESVIYTFNSNAKDSFAESCNGEVVFVGGTSARPEDYAKSFAEYIANQKPDCILVNATARMRDFAALLSGYLSWPMVNDTMSVEIKNDEFLGEKMMYGGATTRKEHFAQGVVFIMPEGKYEAAAPGNVVISELSIEADSRVEFVKTEEIQLEEGNLLTAEKVVGVGLGLGSKDGLVEVEKLLNHVGAALACSRPAAEEMHWIDSSRYVGISNLNIKPKVYFALGISGQVQHIVGVRDAKIIVAVNNDDKANIFRYSDYGIVGDMYDFIAEAIKS